MTADEQYTANMAVLARHANPAIQEQPSALSQVPLTNVQLLAGASGALIGAAWDVKAQQWIPLADGQDPVGQAERDVEAVYSPQVKVYTLLGAGLGYAAVALAKRLKPYQRLSVWETSPTLYRAMFYCVDVAPLFSDKRVHLFVGPDILHHMESYWLSIDVMEKLGIGAPLRAGYTAQLDPGLYDALLEKTADMLRHHMVGLSTWKMFGAEIGTNDLANLPEYFASPGYEQLAGLWVGRPAVCVAAGPSLQKNLRVLLDPAMRHAVALVTAGTTYALLQGLHLQPDIVTTIDFQRLNWTDQFRFLPLDDDCPLVYLHSTYPQTVRRWPGPRFVAENASDTVQFFRRFAGGKGEASQVQTVAHLNLLVALMLGADPVCLIGQDLAMPPTQHHAAGARAQDQAPCEVGPEAFVTVPDCAGQPTSTRHSFLSMRSVFERIAAAHPARKILNCTEGGLPLAGIPNIPLVEALAPWREQTVPAGTLRTAVRRVWHGYTPIISDDLLPALATVRDQVDALLNEWCPTVERLATRRTPGEEHAGEETSCGAMESEAVEALLALEPTLQQSQPAFALFIIRDFRLIELLASIPDDARWLTDETVQRQHTCERLVHVARYLREGGDVVRLALRDAARRLQDVVSPQAQDQWTPRAVARLIARQHYGQVVHAIATDKVLEAFRAPALLGVERARLHAQVLEHRQQYAAALAVLEAWELAPRHVARMRHRLAHYADEVRAVLPAYFEPREQVPAAAPLEPPCGTYWGA